VIFSALGWRVKGGGNCDETAQFSFRRAFAGADSLERPSYGQYTAGTLAGSGTTSDFDAPEGVGVDSNGNVYVASADDGWIKKVTPSGGITDFAGNGIPDGAFISNPDGVSVDSSGNVYAVGFGNGRIYKISRPW
jgi:sugar lactone lactonase YvrE